jgi:hypothetical protein
VCVGASDSKTVSDDPSSSALFVVCIEGFPRGVPGGTGMTPLVMRNVQHRVVAWGNARNFVFGRWFLLFLAVY